MYKLIVIDDEVIIREGIANTIPWGKWGFQIVGLGKNGLEALELIEEHKPDMVLTDIKMPDMDGIELIQLISKKYKQIEIVILSGYSDIEYYKEAIECQVMDYILKPTCFNDFEKMAIKAKERMDLKRKKKEEYKELEKRLLESLPYMRQMFMKQVNRGFYHDKAIIKEKLDFYNLNFGEGPMVVMAIAIDDYVILKNTYTEEQNYLLKRSILFLGNQLVKEEGKGCFYIDEHKIIGVFGLHQESDDRQAIELAEKLQHALYELKKITVSIGISEISHDILNLKYHYSQAIEALKQKIFLGKESIICYRHIENIVDTTYLEYKFDKQAILDYIFYRGQGHLEEILDEVFENLQNKLIKRHDYIDKLWYELYYAVARYGVRFGLDMDYLVAQNMYQVTDIRQIEDLGLKKKWMSQIIISAREAVEQKRDKNQSKLVIEVMKYINDNYYDNSISLTSVAEHFNKNHTYISKLFKQEIGEKFSDYIIKQRMHKAMELLKDVTIKTYEVANRVGYADTSHFIKVFKKYTGMSTSHYRERAM